MENNSKKQFLNFLESIKSQDPALIEAFDKSFNVLFEASNNDLTKVYGSIDGKPVFIEINIEDVDAHYVPLTRGSRDSYGAPEEPDDGDYWEIEGYKATAKLTPIDQDGEPTGEPSTTIDQTAFPKVITEKKGYKGGKLDFFNLDDYVVELLQENSQHWDTRTDNHSDY